MKLDGWALCHRRKHLLYASWQIFLSFYLHFEQHLGFFKDGVENMVYSSTWLELFGVYIYVYVLSDLFNCLDKH